MLKLICIREISGKDSELRMIYNKKFTLKYSYFTLWRWGTLLSKCLQIRTINPNMLANI